jgi:hypothetical protein
MTKKRTTKKIEKQQAAKQETALVLRTCAADMTAFGGFVWPTSGHVECPDWDATPRCGGGLHGLLWGEGGAGYLSVDKDAKWLVVEVAVADVVDVGGDKVKFPRGVVVFCGDRRGATDYIYANGGHGRKVHFGTATAGVCGTATAGDRGTATAGVGGTATAGDRGTATAGYSGTATAGDSGTATAGYRGTATAGDRGTATAGDSGVATAGDRGTATAGYSGVATAGVGGVIAIQYWNGKRYKTRIAQVKDEDGDGELEPNTPYRLDASANFVRVAK